MTVCDNQSLVQSTRLNHLTISALFLCAELLCFEAFEMALPYCHAIKVGATLDKCHLPLQVHEFPKQRSATDLDDSELSKSSKKDLEFAFRVVDGNLETVLIVACKSELEKKEWIGAFDRMWKR